MAIKELLTQNLGKDIKSASDEEIYIALLNSVKTLAKEKGSNKSKTDRKVYYISAEFLIGKLLSNNLINLGVYDEVRDLLAKNDKDICVIEEVEPEPSLGNGGLGRLAACFIDSIATLGLNGDGIGLNYHLGLFKQVFENNKQRETPNPWIERNSWLTDAGVSFEIPFKDFTLKSKLYDIDVTGYNSGTNKLHLFDVDSVNENIVKDGISFDKTNIKQNLTLFLYPDDSDEAGHLLRIYQQYFMVSNAAQLILKELRENGFELRNLDKHVAIQINDTHPSLVIPELIRLLTQSGISFDDAVHIVTKTCAYTNHTILAEALEKWPLHYLETVVPGLVPIIHRLADRVKANYVNPDVHIIDENNRVHMARMDMHYGFSVNGVAALHTEILKKSELKPFYDIYSTKFNNKTNGITFRRWLMHCNKDLVAWLDKYGAGDFRQDAMALEKLLPLEKNDKALEELLVVKQKSKDSLADYIEKMSGTKVNKNAIFDIQIKRLHEYKRQQMNVLYIIYKYLQIKSGYTPATPICMIFGAKAAPAYYIAKDIIHTILCLQKLIENDPKVAPHLQVIMVENYNVTYAERLYPACDVSEQISLASKEASGTGNMKFMLNGAITLGTDDGANVEIHELVGRDNIYIFGKDSDTIIKTYENGSYKSADFYHNDSDIKTWVDFIVSPEMQAIGDGTMLGALHSEIINKDWFMTLIDIKDYVYTKDRVFNDYADRKNWSKKMLVNIAKAGFFSSDRTIAQYNEDIWKV